MEAVYERIRVLREAGVTGQMVAKDFAKRRIAPLQWHSEPMWTYGGPGDGMRLREEGLTSAERKEVMRVLFATTSIPAPADEDALPLHRYVEESVHEARGLLPSFDEWGIRPARLCGPRSNPWTAGQEQVGEMPEPEEAEDSGEDEAQRGDNPSGEDGPREAQTPREAPSAPRGDRKSVV